jgi:hypothetical protein
MRHLIALTALSLSLLAGCDAPKDETGSPDDTNESKEGASDSSKPKGPVFQTKMMGMEMTQALVEKDLSGMGLDGIVIKAPEKAEIRKKSPRGHKLVAAGVNYSMTIRQAPLDAKQAKEVFDIIDKEGELLVDEADRIIFKRKSGSHLFQAATEVDGKPYTCSTVATGSSFTRDQVDQMIESCKSLAKK